MCQDCNTTIVMFAVFVVALFLTHNVKFSVFTLIFAVFLYNHISIRVSQYLYNSSSAVFTRLGLSAVG